MAVPKRKMSRSNTRHRRSQWKTTPVTLTPCPVCSEPQQPHMACRACGSYKGRTYAEAINTEHETR